MCSILKTAVDYLWQFTKIERPLDKSIGGGGKIKSNQPLAIAGHGEQRLIIWRNQTNEDVEKTAGHCVDRRNGPDPSTACGGNAVNDKNIADALNDIVKSSVAAGLTKDYTFKPRTDEQAMAKAIAALSEAEWNTKGMGTINFLGQS
ncbi:MAG: hypothetical protein ACLUGP_08980 [Faecalibacterium prausnitzii]